MPKTLIITEQANALPDMAVPVMDLHEYLAQYPKIGEPKTRLINLCNSDKYLSLGYYCSLLAEARNHTVLPSVKTINDLAQQNVVAESQGQKVSIADHFLPDNFNEQMVSLLVYFGDSEKTEFNALGRFLFQRYPSPILDISLYKMDNQWQALVKNVGINYLDEQQRQTFFTYLRVFIKKVWRSYQPKLKYRWDLAVLINDDDPTPPSDKKALDHFVKAASQVGIRAELVGLDKLDPLERYDGLFIRETTAIKHHTYALARQAEMLGLVAIDDATSILRCCNKVYLHDAFSYQKIPAPKTCFVSDAEETTLTSLESTFGYPMVLKLPESSFSKGVFKVGTRIDLESQLLSLLADSALVLVQEYLYTEFDWRIGVLSGKALYACRYHMAKNHWQIYNHSTSHRHLNSGGFETVPTFEVPRKVLQTAIKASRVGGNGLYGIDLKQVGEKVFVIEVNDNPSIDSKIEDKYLGKELYMQIMQEFVNRFEARGR